MTRLHAHAIIAAALCLAASAPRAQPAPANALASPGRPGSGRVPVGPVDNQFYRSTLVELGARARAGLLYEPKYPAPGARVAVLYSDRNFGFDPPAAELAKRGYRVLYVSYPVLTPGQYPTPLDGFVEVSRGISYLRSLPGVDRVVIEGWGAGAASMTLYAAIAEHGAAACQGPRFITSCPTARATGLVRPDGMILLDPGLGAGTKVANIDPAFAGGVRSVTALDRFAPSNGYDLATGTATYARPFKERYFAAQSARNDQLIAMALRRASKLGPQGNTPFSVPGSVNIPAVGSLHAADLSLLSHTKRSHLLLGADGSRRMEILHSIRPSTGPVGATAIKQTIERSAAPASRSYSLREYLANDAIRSDKSFALTADDVIGLDWGSSMVGTPAQAELVSVPALIMTDTCFQFVVPSEIVLDHLAAKDKTLVGVEGSEHEFTPCRPEFGDTKRRLFDFVSAWLGAARRF